MSEQTERFLVWGTFDTGKPRVRMLLAALAELQPGLTVCHRKVWEGIEDKSQIGGASRWLSILLTLLVAYPALIASYLRAPKHEVVLVPYPGLLDVLILWPFAKLRGSRICWDMFISAYDTIVVDRAMVSRRGPIARMIHAVEWLATRAADLVLLDTSEHARHVAEIFGLARHKVCSVWVGVEDETFQRAGPPRTAGPVHVLFYGQFIPLHGLDTIIAAIAKLESSSKTRDLHFTIVGTGQEAARIDAKLSALNLANVERIQWVDYARLPALIASSDICLGVFASGGKAARVIPNKVFQILAVGRPLVTMDSPAIREIVEPGDAVRLVRPGDADDLAEGIEALAEALRSDDGHRRISAALEDLPLADVALVRQHLISATETL